MTRMIEIAQRIAAVTEGPWIVEDSEDSWGGSAVILDEGGGSFGTCYIAQDINQGHDDGTGDAEFIAAARQDVPAMHAALTAILALSTTSEAHAEVFGDTASVYVDDIRQAIATALGA